MLDRDFHPDRILARIGILQQQLATRLLDIPDEERRPVDTSLLSHEIDGAFAIDLDPVDVRDARL